MATKYLKYLDPVWEKHKALAEGLYNLGNPYQTWGDLVDLYEELYTNPNAGFVYVWTNRLTNQYYIGSHGGTPWDRYVGSGKQFHISIEEYGITNFDREILYYGEDYLAEEDGLLKDLNVLEDPLSLNLIESSTGSGKWKQSSEAKMKISVGNKGKPKSASHRANVKAARARQVMRRGYKQSPEHTEKNRQARLGKPGTPQKFTPETVIEVRRLFSEGMKRTHIARLFKVDKNSILHILTGRTWKHVTGGTNLMETKS